MEFSVPQKPRKKHRFSFWQHLKGLTTKSKTEQVSASADVTLLAASKLYSSFRHNTNKSTVLEVPSPVHDAPENYITLEDSELQNVHRDAGILFLTSNNQLKWQNNDEQQKHVQFAPTPYNKYHTYSSDPRKKFPYRGKENSYPNFESSTMLPSALKQTTNMKDTHDESRVASYSRNLRTFQEISGNIDQRVMTSFLPRTSTKSGLGYDDSTLPHFNESSICQGYPNSLNSSKFNSLKRSNQKQNTIDDYSQANMFPQALTDSHQRDAIKQATVPHETITHYFIDNPSTTKAPFQANSRQNRYEGLKHTIGFKDEAVGLSNNSNSHGSMEYSKPMTEVPNFTFYNLNNPKVMATNMRTNLRRHSFHQHHIQNAAHDGLEMDNRADFAPCTIAQHTHLKKARVPEPPGTISVGKPMSINQQVTQVNDPLIPPFVSLPTTYQKAILRPQPPKADSRTDYRRSYDTKFLFRELPMVPENARIDEEITKPMKFATEDGNHKNCRRKQKSKYDGVSSMADDECSLNCSCGDCLIDLKRAPKEIRRSYRREHAKAKLFFPEDQQTLGSRFHTSSTNHIPAIGLHKLNESAEEWYTCTDIMCKSPETNDVLQNVTKTYEENIYENCDVFIADDYEVESIVQTNNKSTIPPADNKIQLSTRNESAEANNGNGNVISNSLSNDSSPGEIQMTPRTRKLSQTCISALKDTLANLLQNYKDQPNPSFSISSVNSDSSDNSNTIVIKIQKDNKADEQKEDEQKPLLPINNSVHWGVPQGHEQRGLPFALSKSLPDLLKDSYNEAREVVFTSTMALSPRTKTSTEESSATSRLQPAKDLTINEELVEFNEEFPTGWDKSPSAETSNSGHSTCSLVSSTNSNVNLCDTERELLKDFIRAGMGIPTPVSKKKVISTPKFLKVGKFKAKEVLSGKAKLKLSIYCNAGLVTIHIMKAVKLTSVRSLHLNPYVKVSLHPDDSRRAHWRSKVVKGQNNPVFNQKFSFEITPGDSKKRLIFSLWHRDVEKKRSEFLGCMSFGVHRVLDPTQRLGGWYRLLKEVVGTKKHFAAGHGKGNGIIKIVKV